MYLGQRNGFTIFELVLTIVIVGMLAVVAVNKIVDLRTQALRSMEAGTVGSVRSGIEMYGHESSVSGRTPKYPAVLDAAGTAPPSLAAPYFISVLAQPVTSQWTKTAANLYTGPANGTYQYDSTLGTFLSVQPAALSSSFDSNAAGWTSGGNVTVQGGRYVFGPTGNSRAYAGQANWTNYEIKTQAKLTSGSAYSLLFRLNSASNPTGYAFQYDRTANKGAGAFVFRRWVNGSASTVFATASAPSGFVWTNTDRAVTLTVRGSTFTASVDGQQVLTGSNGTSSAGRVGISAVNSGASFDNYQVRLIP